MSFRLTYATMFDPPPQLHGQFEAAVQRALGALGTRHRLFLDGVDHEGARHFVKSNPADSSSRLGEFPAASAEDAANAMRAAQRAWPAWRRLPPEKRAELLRGVSRLIEERVYDNAAALTLEVGK